MRRNQPEIDIEKLRREIRRTVILEIQVIGVLVLISAIIMADHIRQATGLGFTLSLALLVGLYVLGVNSLDCVEAWKKYTEAKRLDAASR